SGLSEALKYWHDGRLEGIFLTMHKPNGFADASAERPAEVPPQYQREYVGRPSSGPTPPPRVPPQYQKEYVGRPSSGPTPNFEEAGNTGDLIYGDVAVATPERLCPKCHNPMEFILAEVDIERYVCKQEECKLFNVPIEFDTK